MSPATAPMRTPARISNRNAGARFWYTAMANTAPPTTHKQQPQDNTEIALKRPAGTATKSAARIASRQEIPCARASVAGDRPPAYPLSDSSCWANFSCGEPQFGQNSSDAISVAPQRWQSRFIPFEAISRASVAQSASVSAVLLAAGHVGQIHRDQAEVSGCGVTAAVQRHNVLMAGRAGLQLQVIRTEIAVWNGVGAVGVVAAKALPGCGRSAHRLIPHTFDHAPIFAQSLAIKSQHLIPAVGSGVVSRLYPQLPGAEPHVDFG